MISLSQIFSYGWLLAMLISLYSCQSSRRLPFTSFYKYDHSAPLNSEMEVRSPDVHARSTHHVRFTSFHQQEVTGILSLPEKGDGPFPVIILIHGLGDEKEVDYIAGGATLLLEAGYAVLRLDLYNHGEREISKFEFSFDPPTRYRTRQIITQSVFDLQRAVDFIESVESLDASRIGYFGISLGGIIGTIFSGIDVRIKVPVIVLAGGRLNLIRGTKALTRENLNYFGVMDPIHFVRKISPRPLLMINALQDEVVPPATSRFLFQKARQPKEIIWYEARHKTIPVVKAYADGIAWFDTHL